MKTLIVAIIILHSAILTTIAQESETKTTEQKQATIFYNKGVANIKSKQLKLAQENFKTAIKLHPYFAKAYYNIGVIKLSIKDEFGAMADFKTAVKNLN